MRVIKVQQGQNLFDVAISMMGSALGAVEIALANNISVTETLSPGQELKVPLVPINASVVNDLKKNGVIPATVDKMGYFLPAGENYSDINYVLENYWL